ncbi:MAG TPA: hypothetical protein VIA62_09225 [Thermoanaerobaculia bacterium]|jgi:hypothetical protein|nr:hypothetical protein [Thermoanaerobaculia bacterium]
MPTEYSDLRELLDEILETVPDSRSVWCTASIHFETTVVRRRGVLLGGAWAPQLLGEAEDLWPVPWTMTLLQPRVLAVERLASPFWKWLPLLEGVAKADESMVVATAEIGDDFLRTLVANLARRTIKASAVRSAAGISLLGRACADPPCDHRALPRVKEAWVRKGASVVFPWDDADWPAAPEIAIVEVGGEDCEDQRARLRFLAEAIREADRRG